MKEKSPLEAYIDACTLYLDIQDLSDGPADQKLLREQLAVIQTCFQSLLGVAVSLPST